MFYRDARKIALSQKNKNLVSILLVKKLLLISALACAFTVGAHAQSIFITEINSNGAGGDFFEIYNSGTSVVDFTGWRWSDYDLRNWATASAFEPFSLNPGAVVLVNAGSNLLSPTPLFGSAAANGNFRASWGLSSALPIATWTGNGAGLGSGDGIILFNASGNVETSLVYRVAPLVNATNQDATTVALATFLKSFNPQPAANAHAGAMGGGLATESLVWDPGSGNSSPSYRNAVAGQWSSFANPNNSATVGSPGVVPEPSTYASLVLAGLGAVAYRFRRCFRR